MDIRKFKAPKRSREPGSTPHADQFAMTLSDEPRHARSQATPSETVSVANYILSQQIVPFMKEHFGGEWSWNKDTSAAEITLPGDAAQALVKRFADKNVVLDQEPVGDQFRISITAMQFGKLMHQKEAYASLIKAAQVDVNPEGRTL